VLVSALFALSEQGTNEGFVLLAYVPALIFWGLDGYFLWQERLYRMLYDVVRDKANDDVDFSMNIAQLSPNAGGWVSAMFSMTLSLFHGALLLAIIIDDRFSIGTEPIGERNPHIALLC